MNIENRLKLLKTEKTKILGFGRSHLRSVESARKLESDVEKRIRKARREFTTKQAFLFFLWDTVRDRGDELLRREHFQFRVFDEGTVEFLDQNFIKRPGNGFATRYEDVANEILLLPEKVRAVLQLHYSGGMTCKAIAKKIEVPVEEVYQLWQHSLIYLWEALRDGETDGFEEAEDETFWTLALKYLDGTASEKFVAQLNSEIHVSKNRTRQYNDLRMIDGIMIGFAELDLWPECPLADKILSAPTAKLRSKTKKKKKKPDPEAHKEETPPESGVAALGFVASLLAFPGRIGGLFLREKSEHKEPETTEYKPFPAGNESNLPSPEPHGEEKTDSALPEAPPAPVTPVLAKNDRDQSRRHGVHIDKPSPVPKIRIRAGLLKKLALVFFSGIAVATLVFLAQRYDFSVLTGNQTRVLRASEVEWENFPDWNGVTLETGTYRMNSGTIEIHTPASISLLIEAPAAFTIDSASEISLSEGRLVAKVPATASDGFTARTEKFVFHTSESESAIVAESDSIDVMVFVGEGNIDTPSRRIGPGEGLRFSDEGEPETFAARDEAHRLPETIPVVKPKRRGDNLVLNHSFEIGLLSRSCKTERLYRDIPLGWQAGWQREGVWTETLEQHSGTVQITDAIGGLPTPVDGERYLWVNHGFVAQEINRFEPGMQYELTVQIGSHRNLGPGAGHLIRHSGGNVFRFGIWSGSEWIAQTSGQLEAGQPFQEMKLKFRFPESGLPGMKPVLMLTGETRIFYDNVVLKKLP